MTNRKNSVRIAGIIRESIVDGPGLRFVVFAQGCPHHCEGCHNPATHDFAGGYECDFDKILKVIDENPLLTGVTFSGGEPFCQSEAFCRLGKKIKERGLDLVTYSGYTLEELQTLEHKSIGVKELLSITDYLIDGPFILSERDLSLEFRGSRNQRIINLKQKKEEEASA